MISDSGKRPTSLILSTATRCLLPLLLIFSIYLVLRGHNEPGGGFVGGLTGASAFALYAIANDVASARRVLRVEPRLLMAWGLATAVISGLVALASGQPFMTGKWTEWEFPVLGKVGTPLLFDSGVYLLVLGITLMIIFALAEE